MITGNYLPGKNGGIENYTHWLATILLKYQFQVEVAALNAKETEDYSYEEVKVNYLKNNFSTFTELLITGNFDICHFQEYSAFGGIELHWFKEAKKYCKKVFFTFHLPYLTCYKNDFRYKGISDCNDFSSTKRCVKCIIATKLNYKRSSNFNLYNFGINLMIPLLKKANKINELKGNIQSRKDDLMDLISTCDNIFIYGAWFKKILINNGYQSPKLKGISHIAKITPERKKESDFIVKNKLLFIGRIEKQKGLHLLCKAMNLISNTGIQLDVFGNIVDHNYYNNCKEKYDFNYRGSVPRMQLLQALADYDFLILPSVFTEMFSLALREAFYEKLPAIVSSAKGNKDVVTEGMNGFIFEYDNFKDLARVIDKAYKLKQNGWKPVFHTSESAENGIEEILSYYYQN